MSEVSAEAKPGKPLSEVIEEFRDRDEGKLSSRRKRRSYTRPPHL